MRVAKVLVALGMLLLLAGGVFFYLRIEEGRSKLTFQPPDQRRQVGNFRLETPEGERNLEEFRGQAVLVDVWASWCAPCLKAVPKLIELQSRHSPQLAVIGLNVDEDGWPAVERFRQHFPAINYLIARPIPEPLIVNTIVDLDPLGQVSVLPTAFLLDREGRLVGKYVGVGETEQVDEDIVQLLREEK